ncbi:MAG: RsmB/NOP family class I SAM-dependent RNA methyltransferase [Sutterellaceae bacterium]|nr:RsmB/NOP family class I SAM-dependent RNA methyltransferase [Sutterellaceae bacterium]MDY2867112.1 RsmB/NOP family class I SAM-dependent RNA methyltransferase [Mesosutterella sp.]
MPYQKRSGPAGERPGAGRRTSGRSSARNPREGRGNPRGARTGAPGRRTDRTPGTIPSYLVTRLAEALQIVLRLDGPADVLLSVYFKRNHELGSRDRGFVAEAVYSTLRHLGTLRWRMAPAAPERSPRLAALVSLAQIYGRNALAASDVGPDAEALDAILAKPAANADPAARAELPEWLYELLRDQYPDHDRFFEEIAKGAPLDVRVNLMKGNRADVLGEIEREGEKAAPTPWSPDGIRFAGKPGITRWPLYRDGVIDVQDEGSQLIARLLAPKRREMVCDFCAGAGGKTLALGALMRSTGSLYAFDVNAKRLQGMVPRLRRSGLANVHPIAIRDEHDKRIGRLAGKFDRVLVDAPCSGTGTLRRNPDLRWRITERELERINTLQASIIRSASRLVKNGGRLVYATCSVLRQENQAIIESFLAEHPEFRLLSAYEVLEAQGARIPEEAKKRFSPWFVMLPQVTGTDGFFGAVLERSGTPSRSGKKEAPEKAEPEG